MINSNKSEKGQALVLIALGIVVLIGFIALGVDVGMSYSGRRQSQNAVDAAAMSAALSKCAGGNQSAFTTAARTAATTNGFTDNSATDNTVQVRVNNPPSSGTYQGNAAYIEVVITTTTQPIFSQVINTSPTISIVRAVSHCTQGSSGNTTQPGLGGEVALLALSPTANGAVTNSGASEVDVDGGVLVNSTANATSSSTGAMIQSGSSIFKMNWAKVRGGSQLSGAFGIYSTGTSSLTKEIDVAGNLRTSGSGQAISGAFNIGGSVINTASVNMTGNPMNVGGSFDNSGAGTIVANPLNIVGNVTNSGSGSFTSPNMTVGGTLTASGASWFKPPSGQTQTLSVAGNISLAGSADIGNNTSDSLVAGGTVPSTQGQGFTIKSSITKTSVTPPVVTVTIPEMTDPLATLLNPPAAPTGSCDKSWSFPSNGNYTAPVTSGGYYCNFNVAGSVNAIIPPGTYWVDYFSLGGAATLKMDGVHLYITGKGNSSAFSVGGSGTISMLGTMLYLKTGSFSFSGASGTLNWTAPGNGDVYKGLSLYMDRSNTSSASLSGSAALGTVSGTWYAPASACSFSGATNTTVYSQFICDTINVSGSSKLVIKYDSTLVYQVPVTGGSPSVGLDQ